MCRLDRKSCQQSKCSIQARPLAKKTKVLFLDEPTAGLDPYSRKVIWKILSERKKGCVTFITTHYLDEADFLADRKMIISNGEITCLGTSTFLKNSYNMNYSLDVYSNSIDDTILVDNIIKFYNDGSIKYGPVDLDMLNFAAKNLLDELSIVYKIDRDKIDEVVAKKVF